jgi:hypothetical protein
MNPTEAAVFRRGNDALIVSTRCRRCNGIRFWRDAFGELQCLDCDHPAKIFREKFEAQRLKKLAEQAQVDKYLDEEQEEKEALAQAENPKIIVIGSEK